MRESVDISRYLQIWTPVGAGAPNLETDVGHIQLLLRLARQGVPSGRIDGRSDASSRQRSRPFSGTS